MSDAASRAGDAAVAATVARMAALVAQAAPDLLAEPVAGGLRVSGPRIDVALVADVRLRALAAQAARAAR